MTGAPQEAIEFHYSLSNDFYRLWLDPLMVYSCGLWQEGQDTLEQAQVRKLDYLVDRARAAGAGRVLDVGCGWGALLERLALVHGVRQAVGLTLSSTQSAHIRASAPAEVEIRLESWADHPAGEGYDAVISVGAFEHFARDGLARKARVDAYKAFFARCHGWLQPGRRLVLQTITKGNNVRMSRELLRVMGFVMERIFPDSELPWLSEVIEASERRFHVVSCRHDGAHYARTGAEWAQRLHANRDAAVALVGEERVAEYQRYLDSIETFFNEKHIDLVRLTFERT